MEERSDPPTDSQNPKQPVLDDAKLHRMISVLVGLALISQDTLRDWLPSWEAEVANRLNEYHKRIALDREYQPDSSPPHTPWFLKEWEYRLIGLAYESPNYAKAGISGLWRLNQRIWRLTAPLRLPLDILGITDISKEWVYGFLERLLEQIDHLEEVGRSEAEYSRILGSAAISNAVKYFSDHIVENEDIRDVITVQTSSITGEVVEEIRERTVSADFLVDSLINKLLRSPKRRPLKMPVPPVEDEKRNPEW